MKLGERIKVLREKRELTLEQVGDYLGVNKATVLRYESGNIDIKRNTAIKLAEILHTTPTYVMGWSDDPSSTSGIQVSVSISKSQVVNASDCSNVSLSKKTISSQALELVEIFEGLDLRRQNRLVNFALELEDETKAENP